MQLIYILCSLWSFCIIILITLHGANSARYLGRSPDNAGGYLDSSQNSMCEGCLELGHPRGHASDPYATGPHDSAERYSESTGESKSAFLSRADQNLVAHHALSHSQSQDAMKLLNLGKYTVTVRLAKTDFPHGILPRMKEFYNGQPGRRTFDIGHVVLALKHYAGQRRNKNADVFIYTMYPTKH